MIDQSLTVGSVVLALCTGLAVGVVFNLVKLPSPAPPRLVSLIASLLHRGAWQIVGFALLLGMLPIPVFAACGPGKIPTYADIQEVSYGRTVCFGKCPAYQVRFTDYGSCEYVGELYVAMPGTYEDDCPSAAFKRAVAALRLHDFYALNYDSRVVVTDVPHYIVSAERCGVTTKLDWPVHDDRQDIEPLMDAFDEITQSIPWQKKSDATAPAWVQ